jgi:hypothetical protein
VEWTEGIFQKCCVAQLFANIVYLESQSGGLVVNPPEFGRRRLLKYSPNVLDLVREYHRNGRVGFVRGSSRLERGRAVRRKVLAQGIPASMEWVGWGEGG